MINKLKIILLLLTLLPGVALAGSCGGFVLFAGYGLDYGPDNYEKHEDMNGERYRDREQGIYGLEYNWRFVRVQLLYHSSSLDNGESSSYGDLNMRSILFKYDF